MRVSRETPDVLVGRARTDGVGDSKDASVNIIATCWPFRQQCIAVSRSERWLVLEMALLRCVASEIVLG